MAIKNLLNRLKFWKLTASGPVVQSEEERLANSLRSYESYVFKTQSILMWEDPSVSILSVIIINILFWILSRLEWRFYGIIFTAILIFTIHEAWAHHIWPEIKVPDKAETELNFEPSPVNPNMLAVSKFITTFRNVSREYFVWLKNLRTQQPTLFCCGFSILFCTLMLLGQLMSGLTIAYLLVMATISIPGFIIHCMPDEMKSAACAHWAKANSAIQTFVSADDSDDEYLPQTSSEDMLILTKVSDLNNEMQKSDDSFTPKGSSSDPVSGLSLMPSHDEASLDSLAAISDLEPSLDPTGDPAEDSDSVAEDIQQIQFQSGHFNGDTSSSDEEEKAFTKDLVFSEVDHSKPETKTLSSIFTDAVTNNIMTTVGKGLLANVIGLTSTSNSSSISTPSSKLDADSDVDNDFEIINKDELNFELS